MLYTINYPLRSRENHQSICVWFLLVLQRFTFLPRNEISSTPKYMYLRKKKKDIQIDNNYVQRDAHRREECRNSLSKLESCFKLYNVTRMQFERTTEKPMAKIVVIR